MWMAQVPCLSSNSLIHNPTPKYSCRPIVTCRSIHWEADLWLCSEDNPCFPCFTGRRISLWSAPLTLCLELCFPSEASWEAALPQMIWFRHIYQLTHTRVQTGESLKTLRSNLKAQSECSLSYHTCCESIVLLKVPLRKVISVPLWWAFLHDCRALMAERSVSSLSIWTMPRGSPEALIAHPVKPKRHQNRFCNLVRGYGPATADIIVLTLHLLWKEHRTNLKRPGVQLPANSHLGDKNRVLMGTASRDAVEPRGRECWPCWQQRGGRRKNEWFTGCCFSFIISAEWGSSQV